MKCPVTLLAVIAFSVVSTKAFSQNTQESSHPLLDKYYPQPKQAAPQTKKTTAITQSTQTQAPMNNVPVSTNAPTLSASNTTPAAESNTTATHSIATDSSTTTSTPSSTTTIVTKPAVITNTAPAPQTQVQSSYDPNSLYDTRLGSSSPQYNTYEKNSYGAGTVTTSPK